MIDKIVMYLERDIRTFEANMATPELKKDLNAFNVTKGMWLQAKTTLTDIKLLEAEK